MQVGFYPPQLRQRVPVEGWEIPGMPDRFPTFSALHFPSNMQGASLLFTVVSCVSVDQARVAPT